MNPGAPGSNPHPWKRVALAIALVSALRFVFILLRYSAYDIAKYFLADDAFYYFQVARHLATGMGSTFDGAHVTNGYHPLWLLVATAVFGVVPGAEAPLMVLYGLQAAMLFASAFMIYLALREIHDLAAAFTAALFLASNYTRNILFLGMESAPAFLLTASLLALAMRWRRRFFVPSGSRDAWVIFCLLLALSLARLETGLLAACWLVMALVVDAREGGRGRARILLVGLGLAVAGCTYIAINYRLVGMPFPISGYIKAEGTATWARHYALFTLHRTAFAGLIAPPFHSRWWDVTKVVEAGLLALGLLALLRELRRRDPDRLLALVPFLVFATGFVAVACIKTAGSFGWYRWPALLLGTIATFALVRIWLERVHSTRLALAAVSVAAMVSTGAGWVGVAKSHTLADWGPMPGVVMDSILRFIRDEIPPGDGIGALSSGIFTYFSGRNIENLEGLANGAEFFRARRNPDSYGAYLRQNNIRWVVFRTTYPNELPRTLEQYERACGVERIYDLDSLYGLKLRETTPELAAPNVYVLRLREQGNRSGM